MKQIISVDVKVRKADPVVQKTDVLVVGRFADARRMDALTRALDGKLAGAIAQILKLGDFKGKPGTHVVVYGNAKIGATRVMLVGLGEAKKVTLDTVRKAAALAANQAVAMKARSMSLAVHQAVGKKLNAAEMGRAMAEGACFGSYRYDEFVTQDEDGRLGALRVDVIDPDAAVTKDLGRGVGCGRIIGRAQAYARTMANRPANVIDPPALAAAAKQLARGCKTLTCTVFDKKQLQAKGMGGVLAVGAGSKSEPRFIVLRHRPSKRAPGTPKVGLVGKAITFDSGGISIKPATDMDQMKLDKTGGIAVLGTMKAVAELDLPIEVWGIIPSAENLPSGTSYRPGDIVTTYSGKTVEILNTDAEGRMILCDGLAYAVRQKVDVVVDVATLTGACMVALGKYKAGLMSNDDEVVAQLERAAEDSGENVWHMPSGDEYAEEMKSKIADLRNIGSRWGGACTAAAFLRQFVGQTKWAHLDIAGMDIYAKPTAYTALGSSGFGVRLLTTFVMNLARRK